MGLFFKIQGKKELIYVSALGGVSALQYIELSNNNVKSVTPLGALTNLVSLYLSSNKITDISPLLRLRRLSSVYLDYNGVQTIKGIDALAIFLTGNPLNSSSKKQLPEMKEQG